MAKHCQNAANEVAMASCPDKQQGSQTVVFGVHADSSSRCRVFHGEGCRSSCTHASIRKSNHER
eukprot:3994438-Amphidinium_carterae.1